MLALATIGCLIALIFMLFTYAKAYYLEVNQVRLDPFGLNYFPTSALPISSPELEQSRVVFFGDSRAAGWASPKNNKREFINRGIGSQTTIQTIQRFPYHISPLKPNIVIVQVGINDLKTIALFPGQKEQIVANCQANIKQIVEASRELGAIVIITTIFPTGEVPLARRPFWSDEIDRSVKETNAYIATLASDEIIVFDAFSILADSQGKMLKKYRIDELHINPQGYQVLNEKLAQLLNENLQ
jgi:lysophospholipase L1-like esterase